MDFHIGIGGHDPYYDQGVIIVDDGYHGGYGGSEVVTETVVTETHH